MEQKCLHFGDTKAAEAVMSSNDPVNAKRIGYKIKGFNLNQWKEVCHGYMKSAVLAKFNQNPLLKEFLLSTGTNSIAEASDDQYWGTGINLESDLLWDKTKWADNKLGTILEEVRTELSG